MVYTMPLIKIIQLSIVLLVSTLIQAEGFDLRDDFTKNGVFDLDKCINKHGGSATLGSICCIEKSKEYERKTNQIHNDLMKKMPNASKKPLTTYRQNFKNNLIMCELHFQAYNNWGKPDHHPSIADMERAQCIYDMRKEEYQHYLKLLCLPNYSCSD